MSGNGGRSLAVDGLKLVLALMVVGIHASPLRPLGQVAHLVTAEGVFRLAVPVFLIFNGYYLHAALTAGRGRVWLRRTLGLYALWMVLYLPIYARALPGMQPWETLRLALFGYWHLWYLAGLVMAGTVLLALSAWSSHALTALGLLTFGAGVGLSYGMALDLIHPAEPFREPLLPNRNPLVLSLPCLIAGLLIARLRLAEHLPRRAVLVAAGAGVVAVMAESLALSRGLPVGIAHDTMLSLGLAAPALALAALQDDRRVQDRRLADASGGIYFLHVAFVVLAIRSLDLPQPAIWLLAVAGSLAGTWAIRRAGLARRLF